MPVGEGPRAGESSRASRLKDGANVWGNGAVGSTISQRTVFRSSAITGNV